MLSNSLRRVIPWKAALRANFASTAEKVQDGANSSYNSFRSAYIAQQQKLQEKL